MDTSDLEALPIEKIRQLVRQLQIQQKELKRQAEEAHRESELCFSAIFNASPVSIAITRLKDSRIIDVNRAWQEITGLTREEAIGHTPFELNAWVHPDDRERLLAMLREQGRVLNFEFQMRHKSGTVAHMLLSAEQIEAAGELYMLSLAQNITECKRVEELIRESNEFSHAVLDSMSSHIAVVDRNGVILAVNEPWRRFAIENGTEPGQPVRHTEIGANYLQVCRESHGESSEGAMAAHEGIRGVLDGVLAGFALEYPCHSPDVQRWFSMTVSPLGSGERGAVISHTDISARRRAEEALRDSEKQLQALARRLVEVQETSRRELARELHDRVGQNLTALSLSLDVPPDLLSPDMLPIIGTRLDDSLRLVAETMDRVRDLMAELRPPMLDDFGLVAALRWYGQEFARRTGLAVAVQCPAHFPRLARELEISLFRIAQEALTNVGKHAHAGSVSITAEATSARLLLTITDDGIGFDPAALDAKPHWGLIAMRERALTMGWELHIESGSGKGTVVTVEVTNHVYSHLVGG